MVKSLPVEEMEKLLLANITYTEAQAQKLASQRAAAVQQHLLQQGNELASRVFLKSVPIDQPPAESDQPASRVEFGVSVK